MKGQIKVEFIIGIVFFAVLIFYVANFVNTNASNALGDAILDGKKIQGDAIMTQLLETSGEPYAWTPSTVKRLGLAYAPYSLSSAKLNYLNTNCNMMDGFGLVGYRFSVYAGGVQRVNCGSAGNVSRNIVITKNVYVEGSTGVATMVIW